MNERPYEALTVELMRSFHSIGERLEAALEPLGLSVAKFRVLDRLAKAGEPLPLGTLAEHAACVRSNITQLIDRLEIEKLVVRADDPRDRRSVRAELTTAGRARLSEASRAIDQAERDLFSALDAAQQARLIQLLGSIRGAR